MKWSTQMPKIGGIEAASIWPAELLPPAEPAEVVDRADAVAIAAPTSSPRIDRLRSRNASEGTMIPKNIASPPRRGIGIWCTRRSSGRSTAPSRRAIPATAGVKTTTIASASAAP